MTDPTTATEPAEEPADAGNEHTVPGDLVQLHEIMEWDAALGLGPTNEPDDKENR